MTTKRCVLAGGSGFLGTALAGELVSRGYDVVVLTRKPGKSAGCVRQISWDGKTLGDWLEAIDGAEAVVNLSGKSVICRYTQENRQEILASRVDSVKVLGEAILRCKKPPQVWVQCGSLAIYGDTGERTCDDSALPGKGFSAETCLLWEEAFSSMKVPATRKVLLRIGIALGKNKGALGTLANLARFYLGGTVGNGRQYVSWLHMKDLTEMFLWAIQLAEIKGVFNACGPKPITNAEFMLQLRRALHRPWSPPIPAWAVVIGSRLMGTEAELALAGRRCIPKRFQESGFEFRYPLLEEALRDLFP